MADLPILPDNPALLLKELRRRDFCAFLSGAWPLINGGQEIAWNWHIEAIGYELDQVAKGDNRRLLVNLPPRNGKSKIVSVIWVAYMLGRDPTRNFVCVSYSNELSGELARDCLALMRTAWYRELFPGTLIARNAAADFTTFRGGGRLATSVTGTLTGRGGDIIILDDVIKPSEANSEAVRNSVNAWYRSTLASRLNDKASGAILLVMQRVHQNDLSGALLETGEWRQLKLPAIATEATTVRLPRGRVHHRLPGEVLHPAREPLGVLEALKAEMGSIAFAAQYQQEPVPADGNAVKREWLRTFDPAALDTARGIIVQSWDTASKDNPHNDYSACVTALVRDRDIYVLDVFRKRMQIPELKHKVIAHAGAFQARVLLIEDAASGQQVLQLLRAEANPQVPDPISYRPNGSKLDRALGVSADIEAGRLHLPHDAPWLADFESELLGFPNSRHDDQVDALSQLMDWRITRYHPETEPVGGYVISIDDLSGEDAYDIDDPEFDPLY